MDRDIVVPHQQQRIEVLCENVVDGGAVRICFLCAAISSLEFGLRCQKIKQVPNMLTANPVIIIQKHEVVAARFIQTCISSLGTTKGFSRRNYF